MTTTMTAATTPAPAYGPDPDIAGGENASPDAAGPPAPYATHPNPPQKETIPMTNRTFTAAELHEILSGEGTAADKVQALYDMIIPMTRPTLADMTEAERAACRWMQCDYGGIVPSPQSRGVIGYFGHEEKKAVILTDTCGIVRRDYTSVTPRPDLPRLTWPGDKNPAPAVPALPEGWRLADHKEDGRVIVTNTTPNRDGRVYFVLPAPGLMGRDGSSCTPDELTYIEQGEA